MNKRSTEIFKELIDRWLEEFARAVEMFTGEKPVLSSIEAPPDLSESEISSRTWWKQLVQGGEGSFAFWGGAKEELWTALGEGAESQSSFFEMLSQANQGTAAVLSAGFPVPLRCEDGIMEAPVLPLKVEAAQIKVGFKCADAGIVVLLVEASAFDLLNPSEPDDVSADGVREDILTAAGSPPMLSRLLDLQLPVSVLLGKTTITIKEALKLMAGSVIELDRQVGDYVEIMVHGTVVAKGEIVSVKGNYGVRIKEIISRQERIALREAA